MGRVIYLDCFAGAAGDMFLGALLDAGLPQEALREALGSLGVGHRLEVAKVTRAGLSATHVTVRPEAEGPGGHAHRHLPQILRLLESSNLSPAGKARAEGLFRRMAEAEAAIHGIPVERVHLHEVGAVDSIIDVAGAVFGFEWFGIDDVVASPLNVGAGTVTMAHGTFPVPAPATLRLVEGAQIYSTGVQAELLTPTGALLVTGYARAYGPMPAMRVAQVGYGAGTRTLDPLPNVLRLVVGDRAADSTDAGPDRILRIECEIDDMSPQLYGPLMERLLDAGALDVYYTAVQMKKNRPGTLISVLAPPELREAIAGILFTDTTTIGIRYQDMARETLDREVVTVPTPLGEIRFKVARRAAHVVNVSPEFDDCARLAALKGVPLKEVYAVALAAWMHR